MEILTRYHRTLIMLLLLSIVFTLVQTAQGWGSQDKVKLVDVQVLTLYNGKMTTARRSYPVPQLKCTGGSAGCGVFVPEVVQCMNKGSDGYDVQWECKTDMDVAYRFGKIEVFCEGYDYPDDPYILKGSCGLEYTIELNKDGTSYRDNGYSYPKNSKSSMIGHLIILGIVALLVYAFYQTCVANRQYQYSSTDDGSGPGHRGGGPFGSNSPPPAPGFRPEYTDDYGNAGCGGATRGTTGSTGGGFWTGAATGGLLGYMFGRNNGYSSGYQQPYNYAPSAPSWGSSSSFSGGGSSGTRSASGFGGTRRR